jgi:hypothetical protein
MKRQLISKDDAVDAKGQHTKPCSDCPWARDSLPGWLGGIEPATWLRAAHGEEVIHCHALAGAQCAGSSVYRANVLKNPRDPEVLRLPKDKASVFATPAEFLSHHEKGPK